MSTAQDLPLPGGVDMGPALRLVPAEPLDFDEAVRRLRPRLHRYAVRRLGDLHEAEELVQEALLRAYNHRARLLTEDDLAAWTTVVTGRLVIDRLRVRGRSTSVADVPETRVARDTAEVVVARHEARLALDALDAMPPRQAAVLWAREVEGLSYEELCVRFRMSEPAVRSVLTRARKALRREYSALGGTVPVAGLAVLAPWIGHLTWADRLRRTASRLTAPAALSAVGVTALGGLVLSPFGLAPQDRGTFHPTTAVVTGAELDPVLHGPVLAAATAPAPQVAAPTSTTPHGSGLARVVADAKRSVPCVNDADAEQPDRPVVTLPDLGGGASAGSSRCDGFESTPGNALVVNQRLPENPTGYDYLTVTSDQLDCALVPTTPLVTCTPDTQPGATQ